ncbi:MAG: class I SAM-dependent methyltransferase [Actinomycetota bacterium]
MSDPPRGSAAPHPGEPYFAEVAEHLGAAYLRYSFTKGSLQEVRFLLDLMRLPKGARLLDVGCGPGRHAVPFAQAGLAVTGIDISSRFLDLAAQAARAAAVRASFFECDARRMPFDDEFDAVVALCQGGFGLMGDDDPLVLRRMAEAAKPGGWVIASAFSAYFSVKYQSDAILDADKGIAHERTTVRSEAGEGRDVDLWTSVFTPRELRLLSIGVGLVPEAVYSIEPGAYARTKPHSESPEFLLVARKPG